ncbi:MAG TPA: efflux RND transporter periplasmic adaptor subunit [Gemmatimonadaceae bacterium]
MKRPIVKGLVAVAVIAVLALAYRGFTSRGAAGAAGEEEAATIVPVSVATIKRSTLHDYVDTWGTVDAEPASGNVPAASARVATPVAGIVAQVRVSEGQRVAQGALLFSLDSRVADVALARSRQAAQFAEQAFARQQKLGVGEATSQKTFQEAEQNLAAARGEVAIAEAQRALLDVRAPLAGTVVKVGAKLGDAVDPSVGLAEIIDLERLVVTSGVRSADVSRVRRGQPVALDAKGRLGAVVYVGDQVDSKTDNAPVRVSLPRGTGFRPGEFLKIRIVVDERRDRLTVPVESIVTQDGVSTISIVAGDKATRYPVKTGLRDGDLVEVEGAGVKAGMTVVTVGAYGLPAASRIKVVGK